MTKTKYTAIQFSSILILSVHLKKALELKPPIT